MRPPNVAAMALSAGIAVAVTGATVAAGTRPIAFINVNVISMDGDGVSPGRTVLVREGRITAVGSQSDVPLPADAAIIDGAGRYLLPGLTDAHVHLTTDMPWAPARPDFGDAPLYLAHGVTTVINLRGSEAQLEWRRRIERGDLIGPTIYTAGEFINEPRVRTAADVTAEVDAQRRSGYDLVKFHEVWTPGAGFLTKTGLARDAYTHLLSTARDAGVPIVGHAPVHLGLDTLLAAGQPLAHLGALNNIYFMPFAANRPTLVLTAVAIVLLIAAVVVARGIRRVVTLQLIAVLVASASGLMFFPGGPLFDSVLLRVIFTVSILGLSAGAALMVITTVTSWRQRTATGFTRASRTLACSGAVLLATVTLAFWLPVAWRSSDSGIERLARRLRDARIPVQTTLVAYDAIGGPGYARLAREPSARYLPAVVRERWSRATPAAPGIYRYTQFMQKVAGTLHRAGVPLIAGTDAMGVPLIAPGSSLHRELELLQESGLTPVEVIRAATVAPARFLGKENEFGTIAVGRRADLLLVDGNPLEQLDRLRAPAGVMARGRWFPRDELERMLEALAPED